ncbi:serine/threonine protein kinase, CMGC group [Serendipita sp. 405]|nr:serine/threonine protein kinase, CMGC group [Serendipita sp. 405]
MDEEAATEYQTGGYLRVSPGDSLGECGRYTIKRKLGWGVFSTVWLAEDTVDNRYVAIKICRSDRDTRETADAEIHALLETLWHGHSQDNIVRMIDHFFAPAKQRSSRAEHACLVFEILGPNLLTFLEAHVKSVRDAEEERNRMRESGIGDGGVWNGALPGPAGGLPLPLVKEFAKQMLAGVAYLHDFCRTIHTDLKPENVAIIVPDIDRVIRRDLSITTPASSLIETSQESSRPKPLHHDERSYNPPMAPIPSPSSAQIVQIYESQPIPTPIYRFVTPRGSLDDEDDSTLGLGSAGNSISAITGSSGPPGSYRSGLVVPSVSNGSSLISSVELAQLSSSSSNGSKQFEGQDTPTMLPNGPGTKIIPVPIGSTPSRDILTSSPSAASPSSPIMATLASFSKRLSSGFGSISLSAWPFARSPPGRGMMSALRPSLDLRTSDPISPEEFNAPTRVREPKPKVLPDLNIKIVDFGNAQPFSECYYGRIQTRQYRAPEVILGRRDWDRKVDVWSIACIIFELVTNDFLFDPPEDSSNRDRDHIYRILEVVNPEHYDRLWVMGGRGSSKIFDPQGNPERVLHYQSLQRLLEEKYRMETSEAKGLADFLKPMLEFEPSKRANASDFDNHPWLEGTKSTRPFPPDDLLNFVPLDYPFVTKPKPKQTAEHLVDGA